MFVQNNEMEQLVAVPIDEYEELIRCHTQLNAVYGLITLCHSDSLKTTGKMAKEINADVLEVASGYEENENYFQYLREKFIRRNGR